MMTDNYLKLARANLERLYGNLPEDLEKCLPAEKDGQTYSFTAFGQPCLISPEGITLGGAEPPGVIGILLSLYALNAVPELPILEPFKAFKEFTDSAPYVGAFASHTEQILVPVVQRIKTKIDLIVQRFSGEAAPSSVSGDFAFVVASPAQDFSVLHFLRGRRGFPAVGSLPLFNNANRFMPMDGLADVGEYTSKTILEMVC